METLDSPEKQEEVVKFKSRVPSDLMIVFGLLHVILGLLIVIYYFNILFDDLGTLRTSESEYMSEFLMRRAFYNSLILFFGTVLLIGGIGLVRHQRIGWIFILAGSIFGILLPALKFIVSLILGGLVWSTSELFVSLFLIFFGASFVFLISKTIREFFQPTMKSYLKAGIILGFLSIQFLVLPFLIAW